MTIINPQDVTARLSAAMTTTAVARQISREVARYARKKKPAAGQGSLSFSEDDHPRDASGKFTGGGGGGAGKKGNGASEGKKTTTDDADGTPFTLKRGTTGRKSWSGENQGPGRQGKLFVGSHTDLPGQGSLFDADGTGRPGSDEAEAPASKGDGSYPIGHKTWFRGDEVTITSEPFELHGSQWQSGVTDTGKAVTIPTPKQTATNTATARKEWQEQQEQFRELRERQKNSRLASDFHREFSRHLPAAPSRDRYAASADCQWRTIGAGVGDNGKNKGGARVCLSGGKIVKGPKKLAGRSIKTLIGPSLSSKRKQALKAVADRHGIAPAELQAAAEQLLPHLKEMHREREFAKSELRSMTGLTEQDVARIENAGLDYASDPGRVSERFPTIGEKLRSYDQQVSEWAGMHPEMGVDPEDAAHEAWELLREGKRPEPKIQDEEVLDEAAEEMQRGGGFGDAGESDGEGGEWDFFDAPDDLDSVPFSRMRQAMQRAIYQRLRVPVT